MKTMDEDVNRMKLIHILSKNSINFGAVGTCKHQKIRIDGFKRLIRVFPDDLSVVQGFCEVWDVKDDPFRLIFLSVTVLPETLVSGLWEVLLFPGLAFPDGTFKYY